MRKWWSGEPDKWVYYMLLVFVLYVLCHLLVAIQQGRLTDGL